MGVPREQEVNCLTTYQPHLFIYNQWKENHSVEETVAPLFVNTWYCSHVCQHRMHKENVVCIHMEYYSVL